MNKFKKSVLNVWVMFALLFAIFYLGYENSVNKADIVELKEENAALIHVVSADDIALRTLLGIGDDDETPVGHSKNAY